MSARDYFCAECGTTEATTYVVTITGPTREEVTEVCRACDDFLRELEAEEARG